MYRTDAIDPPAPDVPLPGDTHLPGTDQPGPGPDVVPSPVPDFPLDNPDIPARTPS